MTAHEHQRIVRRNRRWENAKARRLKSWLQALLWSGELQPWQRHGGLKTKRSRLTEIVD
jgi:hypothetical protein